MEGKVVVMNNINSYSACNAWGSQRVFDCDLFQPPTSKPGSLKLPGFTFSFLPTPAVAPCVQQRGASLFSYSRLASGPFGKQGKLQSHYHSLTSTQSHNHAGSYFVTTIIYFFVILELVYNTVLRSRTSMIITFAGTKQKLIRGLANGN